MPRLPLFNRHRLIIAISIVAVVLGISWNQQALAGPTPVIQAKGTSGQAPFAVHVHALNSTLGVGTELTARYEWDFGDPNGQFTKLTGWNAAHIYDAPGSYTVKLTITNQNGEQAVATLPVNVSASSRTTIYVSPMGNDTNGGMSQTAPIRTFARAAQLVANSRAILFQRGAIYDVSGPMFISKQNLLVGAYGFGDNPVFYYTSPTQYDKIIDLGGSAREVVIENVQFDSPFTPSNLIVRGVHPHGTNITIRNCLFDRISYAMNTDGGGVYGLLALNNTTRVIGAYFLWANGADFTLLGNVVGGSVDEHNIRLGNASRLLIAKNDLTNSAKSTIWCMLGDHAYVAGNTLREGRFIAGPNFATSTYSERFPWLVCEGNDIDRGVVLYAGAESMMFRNNIIHYDSGEIFSIWGYYPPWDRTCKDIWVVNNTATNASTQYGRFLKLGDGAQNIVVANNLYCAPALNPSWGAGDVVSDDTDLSTQSFHHNLWAKPSGVSSPHQLGGVFQSVPQWDGYLETSSEMYRAYSASDLDGTWAPQFNAKYGAPVTGVFTDFYGQIRPAGVWSVGAVETDSAPPPPPPPPPPPDPPSGDVNGDGIVDVSDILIAIGDWGDCSGICEGDVDNNGVVDKADLIFIINDWG